jgi:predicted nucleotidyltransferase
MRPPSHPQSHLQHPLSRILGNEASVRLLRVLATRGLPLSVSQLDKECGLSARGTRLALENLIRAQVVSQLGAARSRLYCIDSRHPLTGAITNLFQDEMQHWSSMLNGVREVLKAQQVTAAWYYGSVARGEDTPASDFDLAIVVPDDSAVESMTESIRLALQTIEDRHQIRCSVVGLSDGDVLRMHEGHDPFWENMTRDAKVLDGPRPEQYAARLQRRRQDG